MNNDHRTKFHIWQGYSTKVCSDFSGTLAVVGVSAILSSCSQQSPTTTASATVGPSTSAKPPEATTSTAPSVSSPSVSAPSTGKVTTKPVQGAPMPLCQASSLAGTINDDAGAGAGSIFLKLVLTNKSAAACALNGYPGVSMVKAGTVTPLGAPATRDLKIPSSGAITLSPGQSAGASLRYTQAGNYQDCSPVAADSFLIYPPSAKDSLTVPKALTACSNPKITLLEVGAFTQ